MFSPQTLIILAITSSVAIVYYVWTQMQSKVPVKFRTTLYLFTKRNHVYRIEAENHGGLMLPDEIGSPGYVERQSAAITRRSGRIWKAGKSEAANDANRSREKIYDVRENDPNPLTISLTAEKNYQGAQIENLEFKALSNLIQREAAANARIEGSASDNVANKLMVATIIAVCGAVLAWGGFYALLVLYGDPTT